MNKKSEVISGENAVLKGSDAAPAIGDVLPQSDACARAEPLQNLKATTDHALPKKKKTRRGKSKRKAPYQKYGRKTYKTIKQGIVKPEAPHNDNQFLFADHGGFEELDERLRNIDQASTSSVTRTRDSSFSVDSDGEEFFSSPGDDESQYLIRDFNDQYQTVQIEQLQDMSKQELIEKYIALESRATQSSTDLEERVAHLKKELERQNREKEGLKHEIELLKSKIEQCEKQNSDSADSETDSSDSESSNSNVTSGDSSRSRSPLLEADSMDYVHTNGHTPSHTSVDAV